jgi:hypothetical protein
MAYILNGRPHLWLGGHVLLDSNDKLEIQKLLSDIIGDFYISSIKFDHLFDDGDDTGWLYVYFRSDVTFDDAHNFAKKIKKSTNLCEGEYEKFKSWFKSAKAQAWPIDACM